MTRRLLDFFARRDVRATFFIEGSVARRNPALVRLIAAAGHEIGSHSYRHVALEAEEMSVFAAGVADARRRLEDLAGKAVLGFRAPNFSLTPATEWAADVLREAGFLYSSSVLPARGWRYSHPTAPRKPFIWPSGLLEIPCPVGRIGPLWLPFQGGMYLRYLPPWHFWPMQQQLAGQLNWTYCHPYDIDVEAPFRRFAGVGWLSSLFLWSNRRVLLQRWEWLAANPGPPFATMLPKLLAEAQRT